MPLDLTGITNEREFYTDHYIDSVLEEDLRPLFARWTAAGDSPVEPVRRSGAAWTQMRAELEGITDPAARLDSTPEWKKKRHLTTTKRTITDDTLPGGPRERTVVYEAPFDQCDREADYRAVWAEFARRQA
jgi:hypothetical protein